MSMTAFMVRLDGKESTSENGDGGADFRAELY